MFLFIVIFTILFLIFIEYYVGSIMFRYNSDNKLQFNINSGLNFLFHPFHNHFLWNRPALLMNYPFMLSLAISLNLILRYISKLLDNGFLERFDRDSTQTNLTQDI